MIPPRKAAEPPKREIWKYFAQGIPGYGIHRIDQYLIRRALLHDPVSSMKIAIGDITGGRSSVGQPPPMVLVLAGELLHQAQHLVDPLRDPEARWARQTGSPLSNAAMARLMPTAVAGRRRGGRIGILLVRRGRCPEDARAVARASAFGCFPDGDQPSAMLSSAVLL